MASNSAGSNLLAAIVLGIAILGSALVVANSVDGGREEIAGIKAALAELQVAFEEAAAPTPSRAAARGNRPDPSKLYEVKLDGAPVLGPDDAKVTIVEFSDFQCPFCGRVWPTLQKLREDYPSDVRLVFKHLPLRIHPNAPGAHAAAEAAHRQGKFWEMHNAIFNNQRELSDETYARYAQELGLDMERFKSDAASAQVKGKVDGDAKEAAGLGVSGTPSFFINGRYLSGAQPFDVFKDRVEEELEKG